MSQFFSHVIIWIHSLLPFKRKLSISHSKIFNFLLTAIIGLIAAFVIYVYTKTMQIPYVEDTWVRIHKSCNNSTWQDTLNVIFTQNFSTEPESGIKMYLPECPELQYLSSKIVKSGVYWSLSLKKDKCKASDLKLDVLGFTKRNEYNDRYTPFEIDVFADYVSDIPEDSLKSLDYFCFDVFTTNILPVLKPIHNNRFHTSIITKHEYGCDIINAIYKISDLKSVLHGEPFSFHEFIGVDFDDDYEGELNLSLSNSMNWRDHSNIWLKLYDVSRFNYRLVLPKNDYINSFAVYFYGPTELLTINPSPDIMAHNYIVYTNQDKIRHIQSNDLEIAAKFPYSENLQNMKIFILTSAITVLLTLLFRQLYLLLKPLLVRIGIKHKVLFLAVACVMIIVFFYLYLRPLVFR